MHMELFSETQPPIVQDNNWYWRSVNKGKVTGQNGKFSDRTHALRQAKAHVTATLKQAGVSRVIFRPLEEDRKRPGVFILRWSRYA